MPEHTVNEFHRNDIFEYDGLPMMVSNDAKLCVDFRHNMFATS